SRTTRRNNASRDRSLEAPRAPACKPGSVGQANSPGRSFLSVYGRPHTLAAYPRRLGRDGPSLAAYLALLQPGFTCRDPLPAALWALTPLFSPSPVLAVSHEPSAVSSLWHCPSRGLPRAQALP